MFEALGGLGLSSAAGLNAYIPALIVALLARYTDVVTLPNELGFLANGWVLAVLIALLVVEEVVDKIPGADHVNDVVQTIVRPTSGAVVFAANANESLGGNFWVSCAIGLVMALVVHGTKAAGRGVVNVSTAGIGAPVVSVIEDLVSVALSVIAIVLPILIAVFLIWLVGVIWWIVRRRRRKAAARSTPPSQTLYRDPNASA